MARVQFGGPVQDIRGTLAGNVYSRNRGGSYVRAKVSPVQPISPASANTRQSFKVVSQNYSAGLTDVERAAWAQFAANYKLVNVFGNPIQVSGIAMFQALNKRLQQLGFSIFADPPVTPDVLAPGQIAPTLHVDGAGNVTLFVNPTIPTGGAPLTAYLWATRTLPPGRNPVQTDFRLVNDFLATIYLDSTDFGPAYKARFTPFLPAAGDKISLAYAYLDTNTGEISVVSRATILATAIPGPLVNLSLSQQATTTGTFVTATPHGLTGGNVVTIAGATNVAGVNGTGITPTILDATTFQVTGIPSATIALAAETGTVQRTA